MFWHVIVGLLRDGRARHGYELRQVLLKRSGTHVGTGNFYRELTRLTAAGLVRQVVNPPEEDGRRIPYEITERGERAFDDWLLAERRREDDLHEWMLFVDRIPADLRERVIARSLEDLWIRHKLLARRREEALGGGEGFDPRLAAVGRQMKQMAAEIEFLEEFRRQIAEWESRGERAAKPDASATVLPRLPAARAPDARSDLPRASVRGGKRGANP